MTRQELISEALFWSHVGIILFALFVGLFIPWWVWAIMAAGHRLQAIVLGGCVFSKLERLAGSFNQKTDFIQHMVKRFFGKNISARQSKMTDYGLVTISMGIVISRVMLSYSIINWLQLLLALISLLGIALSYWMGAKQQRGSMICGLDGKCGAVIDSDYSAIGPFKLAYLGIVFYSFCFILSISSIILPSSVVILFIIAIIGVVVSSILVALQAFVIKAWCRLCMISAALSVSVFALVPRLLMS